MALQPNRRAEPGESNVGPIAIVAVGGVLLLTSASAYAAVSVGSKINGVNPDLPSSPLEVISGLTHGSIVWPGAASVLLIGEVATVAVAAALIGVIIASRRWKRGGPKRVRTRVDWAARYMGQGRDIADYTNRKKLEKKAASVRTTWTGSVIGRTVVGRSPFVAGIEEVEVHIWGPRTGKSTSLAIPHVMSAPGAVLSTSNKRDVVDATRDHRKTFGAVWVFDPQRIAHEQPTWWWNPLAYILPSRQHPRYTAALEVADVKAATLAGHFSSGSRADGVKPDAFFEPKGESLIKSFFLAAALDGRPITDTYLWTTKSSVEFVVDILRNHGFHADAAGVESADQSAPDQRSGVFETAGKMLNCLQYRQYQPWISPQSVADGRPRFDAHQFVRTTETLYLLSREGAGTATALVTALTAEVAEAAEEYATTQYRGRMPVPFLPVLDEAANVCRWRELPALYSHYGSKGILVKTILQNWSQGINTWGKDGMQQMWDAANVRTYGGGIADDEFLGKLSKLIGDYDKLTRSATSSHHGQSTTRQLRRERLLEIDALSALPRGRAIVVASGAPATMVETIPWTQTEHKEIIEASILAHDPHAADTLAEMGKAA